ncbi:MAG: DUF2339 domain-containing protein, partial [Akkermansiaceae bacterium]
MNDDQCEQLRILKEKQEAFRNDLARLLELGETIERDISSLSKLQGGVVIPEEKQAENPLKQALEDSLTQVKKVVAPPPMPPQPTLDELSEPHVAKTAEVSPSSQGREAIPRFLLNKNKADAEKDGSRKKTPEPPNNPPQNGVSNGAPGTPGNSPAGDWEMTLGRVWLVRGGVLMLLTGLIFLSTYAYKNWLFNAGAGVKVTFFMSISVVLTALGLWLERKKKRFVQYGRVLASGGLAAGYYTVYASHFVPSLRVTDSAVWVGVFLTAWAGLILSFAVWKKSRVVACMAIGLAFYGTVVNPSGWLSLFSALLLAAAGMVLLLRFRWVVVGMGTLIAAYVSHAFWLGFYPQSVTEPVRLGYLASYWVLFFAVLIAPQSRKLGEKTMRAFAGLNNGSAWYLSVFLVPNMIPHAEIGWMSLGIGGLWLGLAALARGEKVLPRFLAPIFGYQGLLVLSLGIMIETTGYARFLVFAVEACILLAGASYFGGKLSRVASVFSLSLALITCVLHGLDEIPPWPTYAGLALILCGYTYLVRRDQKATGNESGIAMLPAALAWVVVVLGVFLQWSPSAGLIGIWTLTTSTILAYYICKRPRWLGDVAICSVATTIFGFFWFLKEGTHLSLVQSLIPIAGAAVYWWMAPAIAATWQLLIMESGTVGKEASNKEKLSKQNAQANEFLWGLILVVMVLFTTAHSVETSRSWLWLGGVYAIIGGLVSELTRRASIGKITLFLHFAGMGALLIDGSHGGMIAWLPTALLLFHFFLTENFSKVIRGEVVTRGLSTLLTATVVMHAYQVLGRPEVLITIYGLLLLAWAYLNQRKTVAAISGVMPLVVAAVSVLPMYASDDWGRYLPILCTGGAHAALWYLTGGDERFKPHRVLLLMAAVFGLLVAASTHVLQVFDGSGLAICWALLASLFFVIGLALRCRPYRLIGLAWIGAAVIHVILIDVMRLETLGRILSFITLGLVLLV